MVQSGKQVVNYYWKDGLLYTADHTIMTVSIPHSVDEGDYPQEVKDLLKKDYFKQLTIE